mmetsp:Transcript_116675/g.341531  ORF Transcript_116675/g.341531 Transcript_116675/m.341531 type:complete len:207 (-) Transcript_116675:359-979(-)
MDHLRREVVNVLPEHDHAARLASVGLERVYPHVSDGPDGARVVEDRLRDFRRLEGHKGRLLLGRRLHLRDEGLGGVQADRMLHLLQAGLLRHCAHKRGQPQLVVPRHVLRADGHAWMPEDDNAGGVGVVRADGLNRGWTDVPGGVGISQGHHGELWRLEVDVCHCLGRVLLHAHDQRPRGVQARRHRLRGQLRAARAASHARTALR